jgi:methyltransferase-like protein
VHIDGNPDEMKFVAYYIKDGKVISVASMQRDPVAIKASELFRLGLFPSVEEIKAGKDILTIDISTKAASEAGKV